MVRPNDMTPTERSDCQRVGGNVGARYACWCRYHYLSKDRVDQSGFCKFLGYF